MKKNIIGIVILILFALLFNYFLLVPLNLRYMGLYFFIVLIVTFIIIFTNKSLMNSADKLFVNGKLVFNRNNFMSTKGAKAILILWGFGILVSIFSSPLIFADSYSKIIKTPNEVDFSTEFSNPNLNSIPIVDSEYARVLGDKKLGSESGLGSEFHVGKFTDIVFQDKFYAVAPLEYNGFFKWLNNRSKGTPGYILIDKTNANVELVRSMNGENVSLKYVESAYLNQDLKRKAYLGMNFDNELIGPFFELDEDGHPYFIYSKVKKTIGWSGGRDVYKVVVVDATSGKVTNYDLGNQPEWIDNVYTRELIVEQLHYYGRYKNGFLNSIFSQEGLLTTTQGTRHIYDKNKLSIYTGLTSVGIDESTVGMAFVNATNKDFSIYNLTGATEYAAMKSAEGKVQDLGYKAAFPIPVKVNDEGAYFITLKDNEGLIKQYAFVNINDYSIVVSSTNILDAYENYQNIMGYERLVDVDDALTVKTVVERVGSEVINGSTVYYIFVKIDEEMVILKANNISNELPLTNVGDEIEITYTGNQILKFNNLKIN